MDREINEPTTVIMIYHHKTRKVIPYKVYYNGIMHQVTEIGLHHTYKKGDLLYHVFSVSSANLFFRLLLNTKTLGWRLERVSDDLF